MQAKLRLINNAAFVEPAQSPDCRTLEEKVFYTHDELRNIRALADAVGMHFLPAVRAIITSRDQGRCIHCNPQQTSEEILTSVDVKFGGLPVQPVATMTHEDVFAVDDYMVAPKHDGKRGLLYITPGSSVVRDMAGVFIHMSLTTVLEEHVVDVEILESGDHVRLVFLDVLIYDGRDIRILVFEDRQEHLKRIIASVDVPVYTKGRNKRRVVLEQQNYQELGKYEAIDYKLPGLDGLIFARKGVPYYARRSVLRWKEPGQYSIDVVVSDHVMLVQGEQSLQPFCIFGKIQYVMDMQNSVGVVECVWNSQVWCVKRKRRDKLYPNHAGIASQIWDSIMSPVTYKEIGMGRGLVEVPLVPYGHDQQEKNYVYQYGRYDFNPVPVARDRKQQRFYVRDKKKKKRLQRYGKAPQYEYVNPPKLKVYREVEKEDVKQDYDADNDDLAGEEPQFDIDGPHRGFFED